MVSYPTMKSSFLGIRGQCWELTHDQNGDVYLEGLDDDHYEKTEVKRCDEDSILLPFVLDEMEAVTELDRKTLIRLINGSLHICGKLAGIIVADPSLKQVTQYIERLPMNRLFAQERQKRPGYRRALGC